MIRKKISIINCIAPIFLLLIYKLTYYILSIRDLTFTNKAIYILSIIFVVGFEPFLLEIIIILYNISKKIAKKLYIRYTSVVGVIVIVFITCVIYIFGYIFFAFTYAPEYIVEKDGKKMVAYVNSYLEVEVNYYDYVSEFIRGNNVKIREDYGSGGYDPFEREKMPQVETYEYFDDDGNTIKSSY
ncbi:MAG: hypothetical protein RR657_07120 [Peptostreptococcaceae bacterium]